MNIRSCSLLRTLSRIQTSKAKLIWHRLIAFIYIFAAKRLVLKHFVVVIVDFCFSFSLSLASVRFSFTCHHSNSLFFFLLSVNSFLILLSFWSRFCLPICVRTQKWIEHRPVKIFFYNLSIFAIRFMRLIM